MNKEGIEQLIGVVPQQYGEAILLYPEIKCEPHEWDNRTTIENAVWLIRHLTSRSIRLDNSCPICGPGEFKHAYSCPASRR